MRILSTAIEELSHRSSNIAAASHMRIQEMLRTLSIEEKFGHIFVSGSLNHAGHLSEFELEISPYGEIFEHFCSCPFHEEEDACGHIIALCEYLAQREFKLPYHLDVVSEQRRRMKEYQAQIRKLEQHRRQRESHTWLQEEAMRSLSVERSDMEDGSISLFLDLSVSALGTKELCRISLRIRRGQERLYVIRDLPRFFDLVRRGEPHSYGKGLCFVHRMSAFDEESQALIVLLQQLHAIEGFHWIRILYMYPDEIDNELIEGMAGLPKVLPYFDIPMQHADRQMLERMNRRGTKEDVLKLVEKIRSTFADPTLRTTFIVGFPGENRETMDELLQFVREVRWDRMGAFTYSPEEDTPGSLMKPVCEESLKQQYLDELMKLQEQIAWENQQKKLGKGKT